MNTSTGPAQQRSPRPRGPHRAQRAARLLLRSQAEPPLHLRASAQAP
jgi:hypothetical protein